MGIYASTLQPPAYSPRKTLKSLISGLLCQSSACQHPYPTFPIENRQSCPDCGAVRDYLRSPRWRGELDRVLAAYIYATSPATREKWLGELSLLFQDTSDVFVGEWRKGGL